VEYEIVWTERALNSLEEVHAYLAQFNPAPADRIIREILDRVQLLATVPLMGAMYPRGSQGPFRVVVSGKCRIFYRIINESRRVDVLLVWHGYRQEPDLPG